MIRNVIAIDAGGSKTHGRITHIADGKCLDVILGSASLSHHLENACQTIGQVVESLMIKTGVIPNDCIVVCGAAGAGNDVNRDRLNQYLREKIFNSTNDKDHRLAEVIVTTDARTSLYGAGRGEPIIVVALGTGSVSIRLDRDGNEIQFGGWGFIAGDLGGGAELGRMLVSRSLVEFDNGDYQENKLVVEVLETIGTDRQQILAWLKNAGATQYAALVPLVFKHQENSHLAQALIKQCANDVAELIEISQVSNPLPVSIIGGLGNVMKQEIELTTGYPLVVAAGDALDGAYYLAEEIIHGHKIHK